MTAWPATSLAASATAIYEEKYAEKVRRIGNPGAWVAWAHYRRLAAREAEQREAEFDQLVAEFERSVQG